MREKNPITHEEKLAYLRELREEAIHAGSEEAVEKQHAKGKLTARERMEKLLDPGSFEELDTAPTSSRWTSAVPTATRW
jgi:propionyl-CoA carboxylase beta chain